MFACFGGGLIDTFVLYDAFVSLARNKCFTGMLIFMWNLNVHSESNTFKKTFKHRVVDAYNPLGLIEIVIDYFIHPWPLMI